MGVNGQMNTIRSLMSQWWGVRPKNEVHKYLLQITPVVIVWEMWKSWCSCKYGTQKKFLNRSMEPNIYWNIKAALGISFPNCDFPWPWTRLCEVIEKFKPVLKVFPVT